MSSNPSLPKSKIDADSKSSDATLLASLGYRQELKREFTTLEMFGFGFSIVAIVPSIAYFDLRHFSHLASDHHEFAVRSSFIRYQMVGLRRWCGGYGGFHIGQL